MDARASGRHAYALRRFASCASDACPRIVREDCRAALAELDRTAPRLFFRVRDAAGQEVTPSEIRVSGRALDSSEKRAGVVLDAGSHRIEVRHARAVAERTVIVGVQDVPRTVELTLAAASPAPRTAAAPAAGVDRLPALVVGGFALAALGTGAALGVSSYADYRDLADCRPRCDAGDVSSARTRGVIADVSLGVGIAGVGLAAILFFAGPRKAVQPSRDALR